jgi:hypothetical protein
MKLNEEKEWNKAEMEPGVPVDDVETMYGTRVRPSNRAEEALPKFESERSPETMSIRSGSMTPSAGCVSCSGTIVSWETFVLPCSVDSATSTMFHEQ